MSSGRAKLTIAYVGELPPHPGGSAVAISEILPRLARMGHRIHAIAPIAEGAQAGGERFADAHPDLAVQRYVIPAFAPSPGEGIPAANRKRDGEVVGAILARMLEREPLDAIIVGRESYLWTVPDLTGRIEVPKLLVVHGGIVGGLAHGRWPQADAEALLERCRKAEAIVVVAHHLADTVTSLGLPAPDVIPNGVDLERFRPGPRSQALAGTLGIAMDAIVISHVSNMKSVKRPLDMVEAARIVASRLPDAVFLVVGSGDMHDAMVEKCRQYGLADRFRFAGWVEHAHLPDYHRLADLMLLPSEGEGLALAGLETMACGRVLVASDIPGSRELFVDGESGIAFPAADTDALADRILTVGTDAALRNRIGAAARTRVTASSIVDVALAYEARLQKLAAAHRR
jgi:glycosyltransferase involved in cell wall biosynthesis